MSFTIGMTAMGGIERGVVSCMLLLHLGRLYYFSAFCILTESNVLLIQTEYAPFEFSICAQHSPNNRRS